MMERNYWDWDNNYYEDGNSSSNFFPWWFPDGALYTWNENLDEIIPKDGYDLTPDMPDLNKKEYHFVFVYGTLKRGHPNNVYLEGSRYLGRGWTKVKSMVMYLTPNNIPVVNYSTIPDACAVQGDIFMCTPHVIGILDQLELNGQLYKRQKVLIESAYSDVPPVKAFMYLGVNSAFSGTKLKLADTFTRRKTGKAYYSYRKDHAPL